MSYRGYIPYMVKQMLIKRKYKQKTEGAGTDTKVRILELGIADGVTAFSVCTNLMLLDCPYSYDGVDIRFSPSLREQYNNTIGLWENLTLHCQNTLRFLDPETTNVLAQPKYDLVLIDGDHNYQTVKTECELLTKFIDKNTILIFDDYSGKYAETDSYYADHEGYENNTLATPAALSLEGSPSGVKAAVDDFIATNPEWRAASLFREDESSAVLVINRQSPLWVYTSAQDQKEEWAWLGALFVNEKIGEES